MLLLPADLIKLWKSGLQSFLPKASDTLTLRRSPEYAIQSLYYLCCC